MLDTPAAQFVKDHSIGVLATAAIDGAPQACTIFYVVDRDSSLIFKSRSGSDHMQSLRRDPRAAVAVYRHDSTYKIKAGIQLVGEVVSITEEEEMQRGVELYSSRFEGSRAKFAPIAELLSADTDSTLYRFTPRAYKLTDGWADRLDLTLKSV